MQDQLKRVASSLPGLAWTALSDRHIGLVSQPWASAHDGGGAAFSFSIPVSLRGTDGASIPGENSGVCFDGHPERFEESMKDKRLLISVVDDDESIRESLPDLINEFGFAAQTFPSAGEFLASVYVDQTKCLILDVAMPGMSGPDLQRELSILGKNIPIIFITGHRDETVRPRLLKEGAVECLHKPFSDADLIAALNAALRLK